MQSIPVAVLGATGYAGETALRILLGHPTFRIVHAGSDRAQGTRLDEAVPAFHGETTLFLTADSADAIAASGAQAVLLAKKSPEVTRIVPDLLRRGLRLVDIGAEFRLRDHAAYRRWYGEEHACPELLPQAVYGLSEIHHAAISKAQVVGNPGCFATSVLLPMLPLVAAGVVELTRELVAVSYSGLSGAGKRFSESNSNLFWSINENLHSYKAVGHQHTGEIDQELSAHSGRPLHLSLIPHLAPITRGIHSTITATLAPGKQVEDVYAAWKQAYAKSVFVRVRKTPGEIEVAHVSGTNFIDVAAQADGSTLIITAALDNLVKGASGQAVQNLNLMFNLPEQTGLMHRGL
jgi:N-acetyl-gamma-glutamyl-phosphate reductase